MKGTIELTKPVTIVGEDVWELEWDTGALTLRDVSDACSWVADRAAREEKVSNKLPDYDPSYWLAMGIKAICAATPTLEMDELDDMAAADALEVMDIGRDFMLARSDGEEDEVEPDAAPEGSEES